MHVTSDGQQDRHTQTDRLTGWQPNIVFMSVVFILFIFNCSYENFVIITTATTKSLFINEKYWTSEGIFCFNEWNVL